MRGKYVKFCFEYNIKLSRNKAKVGYPAINALGFMISKQGCARRETQEDNFLAAPFLTRDQLRS